MKIPAIVTAGDRGAAKAIYGQSKIYLEIEGRSLVARVVASLQRVPEISEVWVVGDAARLQEVLSEPGLKSELTKPLHITEQHNNLYENAWETYKRTLPGAPPEGREPESEADHQWQVLYLSGDLPFATPQELSEFVRKGQALDCDYALGLLHENALEPFTHVPDGERGLDIAYFNLRDGRLKQNNLHLAKPSRITNRVLIQDLYRHRHMRKFSNMLGILSGLFFSRGGAAIVYFYLVMHLAGYFDRKGARRIAGFVRRFVTVKVNEWGLSNIMDCDFRLVVGEVGGSAMDVDTEDEYDIICANFDAWEKRNRDRVEAALGPVALPESADETAEPRT